MAKFPLRLMYAVEAICAASPPESARAVTLARLAATRAKAAGDEDEVIRQLDIARGVIENVHRNNWRDALRANAELLVELVACGRFEEAKPLIPRTLQLFEMNQRDYLAESELHFILGSIGYAFGEFDTYADSYTKSENLRKRVPEAEAAASVNALMRFVNDAVTRMAVQRVSELLAQDDQCCGCGGCAQGKE